MVAEVDNFPKGIIGIPIADPGTPNHQTQDIYRPSAEYIKAKHKVHKGAQKIFDNMVKYFSPDYEPVRDISRDLIHASDLAAFPPHVRRLCYQFHSIVKDDMRSNNWFNPLPKSQQEDEIYLIPKETLSELTKFAAETDAICKDYFRLSDPLQYAFFNEVRYHELLMMEDMEEFAVQFNKVSGEKLKIYRFIALEKIMSFKSDAYQEPDPYKPPKIDSKALPRVRKKLMQMFKECKDNDVKKKALIELNDLLESDTFDANGAFELNLILEELNEYFTKNRKSLTGKLIHIMTETYAKVLKSILLYSLHDPYMAKLSSIVIDDEEKMQTKENVSTLGKMNHADEKEGGTRSNYEVNYWSNYADHCISQLKTLKTTREEWLEIIGTLLMSLIRTGEAIVNLTDLGSTLNTNYHEIKKALNANVDITPSWFPSILMLEKLCAMTLKDPAEFDKIIPHFQKLKEIDIPEIHYGIIVNLEQIAIKTPHERIAQEALKLLLHYIPMRDEKVSYRVVKALGRLLKYRKKEALSNTCYILMELIDAAQLVYGENNQIKLQKKLKKFTSHPEFQNANDLLFYTNRIKYFLNQLSDEGYYCELGGQSFITSLAPSPHPHMLPLLNRMNKIKALKATDPDVYGNTAYHHAAKSGQPHMISTIHKSNLKIDINARNYDLGDTALHEAVNTHCFKTVIELLKCGANPNIKNKEGMTPMHYAVVKNDIRLVTAFLKHGASSRTVNKAGQSPLTMAIEEDLAFLVLQMIRNSSTPDELRKTNTNSSESSSIFALQLTKIRKDASPIILAARKRKYKSLEKLLCYYVDFPPDVALEVIKMMYKAQQENQFDDKFSEFHAYNLKNNPYYASNFIRYKNLPQPRLINDTVVFKGRWPEPPELVQYARSHDIAKIRALINTTDISEKVNDVDEFGNTPLSYALMQQESAEFIPHLIRAGADIEHYNHPGLTPLHLASITDNAVGAKILIDNDAVVDVKTSHRLLTPLHFATYSLNTQMLDLLLSYHSDLEEQTRYVNEQSRYGDTALHMACFSMFNPSSGQNPRLPDIDLPHEIVPDYPRKRSHSRTDVYEDVRSIIALIKQHEDTPTTQNIEEQLVRMLESLPKDHFVSIQNKLTAYSQFLQIRYRLINLTPPDEYFQKLFSPHLNLNIVQQDEGSILQVEQNLRLAYVILKLFQTSGIDPTKQDFFGNNVLHLAVAYGNPFMIKILCHLCPNLFWQSNHEDMLPIETALSSIDPEQTVLALLDAMLIKRNLKQLAEEFITKTSQKLPLNHILAAANLHAQLKELMVINCARCVEQDLSHQRQTSLHVAARYGHTKILKIFKKLKQKNLTNLMNVRDYFENTAGHIAILNNQVSFAEDFLSSEGDLHAKNKDGRTMLHLAASKGCTGLVSTLISQGSDPFERDIHGDTPLHLASLYGWIDVVNNIIENNRNPSKLNARNDEGRTPVHYACLLNFNEKEEEVDEGKGVAFSDCIPSLNRNSSMIVDALVDAKAIPSLRDINGMSPLMIAAANGYLDIVNVLLGNYGHPERAVDIRDEDAEGKTALHHATASEHIAIVQVLRNHDRLKQHPSSEIDHRDAQSFTPFLLLAKKGKSEDETDASRVPIANLYLKSNVNFLQRDVNNRNFLHWACINGHDQLVHLLLEHVRGRFDRMRLHAPDRNDKNTPLHHACAQGHLTIVSGLLANGASKNIKNSEGATPLLVSVKYGHLDVANHLIQKGADITRTDNHGRNIIHYLLERDKLDENDLKFLKTVIALKPELIKGKDRSNETNRPIHYAAKKGHLEAFRTMSKCYPFDDYNHFKWKKNHHEKDAGAIAEDYRQWKFQEGWLNFDQRLVSTEAKKVKRCYHLWKSCRSCKCKKSKTIKSRTITPLCCRPKAIIPGLPVHS